MKNKLVAIVIGVIATLACALLFIACGGNGNSGSGSGNGSGGSGQKVKIVPTVTSTDTFIGKVSNKTYPTEQKAAEAFFEMEMSGDYVGYEVKAELPASDAVKLNIQNSGEVKRIKVVNVKYNELTIESGETSDAVVSASGALRIFQAYIVEYNNGTFAYFAPRPSTGEALTLGYYSSLLDGRNYVNCTAVVSIVNQGIGDYHDGTEKLMRHEFTQNYKIGNDKALGETTGKEYEENASGALEFVGNFDQQKEWWIVRDGKTYSNDNCSNDDWNVVTYPVAFDGTPRVDERSGEYYNDYADLGTATTGRIFDDIGLFDFAPYCSLFQKTATGFMASEKVFDLMLAELGRDVASVTGKQLYADVVGGRIVKAGVIFKYKQSNKECISDIKVEIKNFGNAPAFELPQGAADGLDEYIAQEEERIAATKVENAAAFEAAFDWGTNYIIIKETYKSTSSNERDYLCEIMNRNGSEYNVGEYRQYGHQSPDKYVYKSGEQWYSQAYTYDYNIGRDTFENAQAIEPYKPIVFEYRDQVIAGFANAKYDVVRGSYFFVVEVGEKDYAIYISVFKSNEERMGISIYDTEIINVNGQKKKCFIQTLYTIGDIGGVTIVKPE